MKPLKIVDSNAQLIESALAEVNGKSTAHCFTTYREISNIAKKAELFLCSTLGAKKFFSGAKCTATSGESVANCYKYTRNGTRIVIERRSSTWYLVSINSTTLFPNSSGGLYYTLTQDQDTRAVEILRKQYYVEVKS